MQRKRTRQSPARRLRQCAAVFVCTAALWLIWLTADPGSLSAALHKAASDPRLTLALLCAELGTPQGSMSLPERLAAAQSSPPSASPVPELLTPPPQLLTPSEADEPAGEEPLPSSVPEPGNIVTKTMVAGTSKKYVTSGGISIYNHTDYTLDIDALLSAAPKLTAKSDAPRVLIFHSHATEAYTMDGDDTYVESDSYRTLDKNRNMVRIGDEMTAIFESAGIKVIHDTTLYDYPNYNEAYVRSSEGVARILEQYPSIQLVLDVHRDALVSSDGKLYKTAAGTAPNCAQVMMVMGTDAMGQTHPNWRVNLSLAVSIQKALCDKWATLARPIVLRTSRFNQHQSTGEILLEVGTHGNTLQEAITAARLFSRTVAEMMQ